MSGDPIQPHSVPVDIIQHLLTQLYQWGNGGDCITRSLNDLYSSPNIVRVIKTWRMRWAGDVARMGEERGVYRVWVGKLEGKRPLGRPRRRWVDNIRIDFHEVGCGYMDWIGLAQDRDGWRTLVSAVMNLRIPWNAGNFLTSCKQVTFSRRTLLHGVSKRGVNKLV